MCEVLESINTSIKGYLTRTILKKGILRNQPQGLHNVVCIINSITNGSINLYSRINLNGSINLYSYHIPKV